MNNLTNVIDENLDVVLLKNKILKLTKVNNKLNDILAIYIELISALTISSNYSGRKLFATIAEEIIEPLNIGALFLFLPLGKDKPFIFQCIDNQTDVKIVTVNASTCDEIQSVIRELHNIDDVHVQQFNLIDENEQNPTDSEWCHFGYIACYAKDRDEESKLFGINETIAITALVKIIEFAEKKNRDSLTGLLNRESFEAAVKAALLSEEKFKRLAFMKLDVDCFKDVNENYGHFGGDLCLIRLGQVISENIRQDNVAGNRLSDVAARWGGDEFIIVLPDVNYERGCIIAQRIVETVASQFVDCQRLDGDKVDAVRFTISLGLSLIEFDQDITSVRIAYDKMYAAADTLLFEAKKVGKNDYKAEEVKLSALMKD